MDGNKKIRLITVTVVLFIILSAGFLFGRSCANDELDMDIPVIPVTTTDQHKQDLADIRTVLVPFMAQQESLLAALSTDYEQLQAEHNQLVSSMSVSATQAANAESTSLSARVQELTAEVGTLKAGLQNAVNAQAASDTRFLSSQAVVTDLQQTLMERQTEYDEIYAKFYRINDRTDTAIVELATAVELSVFYAVWDSWWGILMDED